MGWLLTLFAWLYAVLIGNGSELQRLAPIILLAGVGGSLVVLSGSSASRGATLLIGLAAAYYLWRAATSPVWDDARRDVILVTSAVACFSAARIVLDRQIGIRLFLGMTILVLLGNLIAASYQGFINSEFKFLRVNLASERYLSGLVYHRNYLSGILEIAGPLWLAIALTAKKKGVRLSYYLITIVAIVLCFFSFSRGGFAAMVIGLAITLGFFLFSKWPTLEKKAKRIFIGGGVAGLLALVALLTLWSAILSVRNPEAQGIEIMGELKGRLAMSGIAYEIWREYPIFGAGAESFLLLFPQYYSSNLHGGFFGHPRMVHNEYAQVLADYGLVGFALLVSLIIWFGYLSFRRVEQNPGDWRGIAFAGALGAEVIRSVIDFNLHMAPSLLLFSFLAGGVAISSRSVGAGQMRLDKGLSLLLVLGVSIFGVFAVRGELAAASHYAKSEQARIQGDSVTGIRERELFLDQAPEYRLLRARARRITPEQSAPWNEEELLKAEDGWRRVLARNPFDGESLANLARVLDRQGRFDESAPYHRKAIEAVGNRERKYGVFFGYSSHLIQRAQVAKSERKPGECLFLLLEAREVVNYTRSQNYDQMDIARAVHRWLSGQISFLEGARIEKVAVEIIDWKQLTK